MRALFTVGVLVLLGAGCTLSNMTPQARFSEAAYRINDAARWGQLDLASGYVAPGYRAKFLARRSAWGERVSIAEADVVHMTLDREDDRATSVVQVHWLLDGLTLHKTTITQSWETVRSQFLLVDEAIKSGDPALFSPEASAP